MRRHSRRHMGATGVLVYGHFSRLRGWVPTRGWEAVVVKIDRDDGPVLDQLERGPAWKKLNPGDHTIEFWGSTGALLETVHAHLDAGDVMTIEFRPPRRGPIRRPASWRCTRIRELVP